MKPRIILVGVVVIMALMSLRAFSQSVSVQSGQAQPLQMQEHPLQAAPHAMGTEKSLLGADSVTYGQGELPLSDFVKNLAPTVSLGQIARECRSGHPVLRPKITVIP